VFLQAPKILPLIQAVFTTRDAEATSSFFHLTSSIEAMNKELFHNQLALSLGYERIVKDKRINISIDDKRYPDDVMISISVDDFSKPICYKASEEFSQNDLDCLDENGYEDIKIIIDAVHQAYIQATTNLF
jgi:hypothetical protein